MQKRGRYRWYFCGILQTWLYNELFNTFIANGKYPSSWATGIIHPVHEKAEHNVPDNYRKVTVMPCIGKLFESVLNNRLSFKNDVCNDNDSFQAGFRR